MAAPAMEAADGTMLSAALGHAAAGRAVFPCDPATKAPLVAGGFKAATKDPAQVREWWARWPAAMIGWPTGRRSRCWALDVDQSEALDGSEALAALTAAHGPLPDTVESLTPRGGRHLLFRHPGAEWNVKTCAGELGPGLDVRGDGGYIILPPSVRADGRRYEWDGLSDPDEGARAAEAPPWLLALVATPRESDPADTPRASSTVEGEPIPEGRRNDTLFRLALSLRAKGLTEGAIVAALQAENAALCKPPLGPDEVAAIAASAARKPAGLSSEYAARARPRLALVESEGPSDPPPPEGSTKWLPDADDDLACAFIAAHPLVRYVALWGRWMRWDGRVWSEDATLSVFDAVRQSLRPVAANLLKRRRDLLSAKTVAAVERLARSDPRAAATTAQWDADDLALNTPPGLVDLRTGETAPHRPSAYATKITAAGPRGFAPRWHRFLVEVTNDDPELIDFLQRVAGYAATGLTHEHALFFFYGTGANGKGTFLNTLVKLLKDYATVAPMEVFTDTNTDRHPTELAMLRVVRLVVSQETEAGRRWAESRIKAMTGGDPITARFMRQDFFTFEPKFKLLIAGNHKPKLRNVDEAIRRRLHLVPFTVTIPPERRDKGLAAALEMEAEGIMQWIVQGALEYARVGLAPPRVVTDATANYFEAEDLFQQWIEDCCERGADLWEPASRLFASWKGYAEAANAHAGDRKSLVHRLESGGFTNANSRARGGRHWIGLRVAAVESPGAGDWWSK